VPGFGEVAALAVASLDLELVRLLRGAIRTADIEGGKIGRDETILRDPVFERRRHIEPEPKYEQRQVIHPEPRYLPRPIIHPTPRIEPECAPPAADPERPPEHTCPIQPPWKQLVWTMPIPRQPTIKIAVYKTDIPHKGSLLDIFI
jgi:hypothetical protein